MTRPKFLWGARVEATAAAFKSGVFDYDRGKVFGVVVGCNDMCVWVVRRYHITPRSYALLFWKKETK